MLDFGLLGRSCNTCQCFLLLCGVSEHLGKFVAQAEGGHHICGVWRPLRKYAVKAYDSHHLLGVYNPLIESVAWVYTDNSYEELQEEPYQGLRELPGYGEQY